MIKQTIDGIEFKLREYQDFSWLSKYGKVFMVIDETGSGCINFGIEKNGKKYFFKIAGAKTVEAEVNEEESIRLLKEAIVKYIDIKHENLIKLIDSFDYKEFFVAIFEFAEGECLFDHWNFERYKLTKEVTPMMRFKNLSIEKRMVVVNKLFSFFEKVIDSGYLAVDFYDSSIMYDFENDVVTFCDIDLFRKAPTYNEIGEDYYGTKRLKAPEENILGAVIDEKTNEFTLAAIIFDFFSEVNNVKQRREKKMFVPNDINEFELKQETYEVLLKATSYDRDVRYDSIKDFEIAFMKSL